jgi:hypothetical protein
LIGLNTIGIYWNASAGASSYVVQRSLGANSWSVIASAATGTSLIDVGLAYSTIYYYRVLAVASAGTSPSSAVVGVATNVQPDILSGQPLTLNVTRGQSFIGPVATFTDANVQTLSGRFVATIKWGNGHSSRGTVSGANGSFTVSGNQAFARAGAYKVQVTVKMTRPGMANVVVNSTALVSAPSKPLPLARPARVPRVTAKRIPVVRRRGRNA